MTDCLGKNGSDEWNPPTCNKDVGTKQMSPLLELKREQSFLKFPPVEATGLGLIGVSFCALVWHAGLLPFQLHVCPVESWQLLGVEGVPGRKYVVWSSRVLPSLECYTKAARMNGNTIMAPYGKSVGIPNKWEQHSQSTSDLQSNISVRLPVTNLLRAAWQLSRHFAFRTPHNNTFTVEIMYLNVIMQQWVDEAISCYAVI